MPVYRTTLKQTVIETTVLYVQAHSAEQAELIAQYIADYGKDPQDRHFIPVDFEADEIVGVPEAIATEMVDGRVPCNIMPEHAEGLWAPAKERT